MLYTYFYKPAKKALCNGVLLNITAAGTTYPLKYIWTLLSARCIFTQGHDMPNEGCAADHVNRVCPKDTAKQGMQMAEINFQTCSRISPGIL